MRNEIDQYRLKLAIDVDGVIRDVMTQIIKIYKMKYPKHIVEDITAWDLSRFFPIGKDISNFIYKEYPQEIFEYSLPYKNAIWFMKELKKLDMHVTICTNQKPGQEIYTLNWLYNYHIPYDSIIFSKDKSIARCDILLDDYPENLRPFPGKSICYERLWNIHSWKGTRVKDYTEMLSLLKKEKKKL